MKPETKKLIIANLPYLLFVYLFGKLGQTYRLAAGADLSEKLLHLADGFSLAFESAAPSFHLFDLAVGVAGAVALRLMVYCKSKNAKKYRRGVEYGSARWGSPKDIAPYIDPVFDNNILLTQTERLTMNNRPKDPKTARNKNVLVIGGSGSGKTRFFVKPNLMQCVSKDYPTSFVINVIVRSTYFNLKDENHGSDMLFYFLIGFVTFIGSGIVIYSIFYISVASSIRNYGQLRTIGTTKRQIKKMVYREGKLLAAIAIPIGLVTGDWFE